MTVAVIPWFSIRDWRIPVPLLEHVAPFGLLILVGVVGGVLVTLWRAQRAGVPPWVIADAIVHTVLTGFVCSHLFNAMAYAPHKFAADPLSVFRFGSGLSSFGGFFGSLIGAWIWKLRRRQSIIVVTDHIAFGFPLGFALGRVGCFLTHDHPGVVSDFPLAVSAYQVGRPPFLPRHDLGLYEAILSAALLALFLLLGRRPRRPGLFLGLLPTLYAPARFFLDFLRETPAHGGDARYFGLTVGQYSAAALFAMGIAVLAYIHRRPPLALGPTRGAGDTT